MHVDKTRELRRQRSTLRSLALGIIAFGLWSVLKVILLLLFTPLDAILGEETAAYFTQSGMQNLFYVFLIVAVLLFSSADLIPRFYVARKARKESLGQDQGRAWVVWAFILFVIWIVLDVMGIVTFRSSAENAYLGILDLIVSMILDVTATVILGELCFTALRTKKLAQEVG